MVVCKVANADRSEAS